MKDKATERITLRCTPGQKVEIEKAAKAMGLSISEYLLTAALTDFTDIQALTIIEETKEALSNLEKARKKIENYLKTKKHS